MPVVRVLSAVSLAVLSLCPTALSARRDVLELGDADFDYLATEHETMLVKFYAPWSGKDSAPYDGPRTANGIYNYMKKQTGPDSVHLKSKEDLQNFVSNYDASIVGKTAVTACLLGFAADLQDCPTRLRTVSWVMKVASKYTGRGLMFSVANKGDFQAELEDDYGLGTSDGGELPFVTIRTKLGHKYTMREEFT
ncbi:hypothetical protein GOODEAATRI_001520 [Goodea atripinnis]|uniref:Uncharacterized protein n=1 Tax=Goodea atripinnis TaxID=208336 RepID=A0ABV0PAH4_9TELE